MSMNPKNKVMSFSMHEYWRSLTANTISFVLVFSKSGLWLRQKTNFFTIASLIMKLYLKICDLKLCRSVRSKLFLFGLCKAVCFRLYKESIKSFQKGLPEELMYSNIPETVHNFVALWLLYSKICLKLINTWFGVEFLTSWL